MLGKSGKTCISCVLEPRPRADRAIKSYGFPKTLENLGETMIPSTGLWGQQRTLTRSPAARPEITLGSLGNHWGNNVLCFARPVEHSDFRWALGAAWGILRSFGKPWNHWETRFCRPSAANSRKPARSSTPTCVCKIESRAIFAEDLQNHWGNRVLWALSSKFQKRNPPVLSPPRAFPK